MTLQGNPNLSEVLRVAQSVGIAVAQVRGTGELRFTHPSFHPVRINGRRKDTPRALLVAVRRVLALANLQAANESLARAQAHLTATRLAGVR